MAGKDEMPGVSSGEAYYATKKEIEAANERAVMRDKLKVEFQKKYTNPMRGAQSGGYIFDPAMQRYMSMKVSIFEHWKATPKNSWGFVLTTVIPIVIIYKYLVRTHNDREAAFRSGSIPYSQRQWKHG